MIDGFFNMLKPPAMSSHDMTNAVRRILGQKKVGHAGTLDPAAAGVLPVAVGRATRLLEYLPEDKSYRAQVRLGTATDSGDETGNIIARTENFVPPTEDTLREILTTFVGRIKQTPPAYSAVKINGQAAYKLAHKGKAESVRMPEREVVINAITFSAYGEDGTFFVDVNCGKGVYIRSLVADIGKKLGIPAVMSFLVRTRAGGFSLKNSVTVEELASGGKKFLLPPEKCLAHMARFDLPPNRAKAFGNGLSTSVREKSLPQLFAVYAADKFLGLGRFDENERTVCPVKVY